MKPSNDDVVVQVGLSWGAPDASWVVNGSDPRDLKDGPVATSGPMDNSRLQREQETKQEVKRVARTTVSAPRDGEDSAPTND